MPELPEVEIVARQLSEILIGERILGVVAYRRKNVVISESQVRGLINQEIVTVSRRAKLILIKLSSGDVLAIHLRMTGQVLYKKQHEKPDKYVRALLKFKDFDLWFRDVRAFGRVVYVFKDQLGELHKKFGPEPLENDFKFSDFNAILNKYPRSTIKPLLLDQRRIAGIGNIYANEALYIVRIHPENLAGSISLKKRKQLYQVLRDIMAKAITVGGSSDNSYRDIYNKKGGFSDLFMVYRQAGEKCTQCEVSEIERIVVGGRGTFICTYCQKKHAKRDQ